MRYGMAMNAACSLVRLISGTFNPLAGAPSTWRSTRRVDGEPCFDLGGAAATDSSCGQTCVRTVDERTFLVSKRKVRGITLGIQKYLLTCGFTSAKVSDVPDSARRPGLGYRVC